MATSIGKRNKQKNKEGRMPEVKSPDRDVKSDSFFSEAKITDQSFIFPRKYRGFTSFESRKPDYGYITFRWNGSDTLALSKPRPLALILFAYNFI